MIPKREEVEDSIHLTGDRAAEGAAARRNSTPSLRNQLIGYLRLCQKRTDLRHKTNRYNNLWQNPGKLLDWRCLA